MNEIYLPKTKRLNTHIYVRVSSIACVSRYDDNWTEILLENSKSRVLVKESPDQVVMLMSEAFS